MLRREQPVARPFRRIFRPPRLRPWHIIVPLLPRTRAGQVSFAQVIYGFAGIIAIGAILLMLPISSQSGQFTRPVDALFTSTTAVCVTGLTVLDTSTYFSLFGQIVLIVLIQLGGIGFMTAATLFLLILRRRIGLRAKVVTSQTLGLERFGNLPGLIKRVAFFSLIMEGVGALIIFSNLMRHYPPLEAAWHSVFQSVSAFNNCGLDLLGPNFRSLIGFQTNNTLLLTTAGLIIIGGIGYIVVDDLLIKRSIHHLTVDSKIVLWATLSLLLLGTLFYFAAEYYNPETMAAMSLPQKAIVSFFQSVVPRTAGFTAVDIGRMVDFSIFFTILLMFIGGASGSTAGGIKVNTFGILFAASISSLRGKERTSAFGREILPQQVYRALALAILYLGLVFVVALVLTVTEEFSFIRLLFETFSAFGTVGLSTGVTPALSVPGRLIITLSMFIGRVGPLTLVSLFEHQHTPSLKYPQTIIRIG